MRTRWLLLPVLLAVSACTHALEPRAPAAIDRGGTALSHRIDRVIDEAVQSERIVGGVVLVARNGQIVYHRAAGWADREAKRPMREDALFRYASMSKPIVSAAALALVDAGLLSLEDPVTRWLPEFRPKLADGRAPSVTVRQLLTHTSGLRYTFDEPADGPYHRLNVSTGLDQPGLAFEENLRRLAAAPLLFEPGTAFHYSLSIDVLGAIVARAGRGTLQEVVARRVTGPLAMRDTGFTAKDPSRLVAAYADGAPRPSRIGEDQVVRYGPVGIRFAPSRALDPRSYPSGGAGMVGTASDFLVFLETLRRGGGAVLRPEAVRAFSANQIGALTAPALGDGWGFGLGAAVLLDPVRAKSPMSAGSYRWGGVYGSCWWVDPREGLSVVVMTNTAIEGMSGRFTKELADAVYGR